MRKLCCVASVAAVALSATAATASLTSGEIVGLFSGTTIETTTRVGARPFTLAFRANGSLDGVIKTPNGVKRDTGTWWTAKGRLLCWQFERFTRGQRRCVSVVRDGRRIMRRRGDNGELLTGSDWIIAKEGPRAAEAGAAAQAPSRPSAPAAGPVASGLRAPEILALMTGTTVEGVSLLTGNTISITFGAGGAVHGEQRGQARRPTDDGTWWTKGDNLLCWRFAHWANRRTFCNRVVKNQDRIERYKPSGDARAPGQDWRIIRAGLQTAAVPSGTPSSAPVQSAAVRPTPPPKSKPADNAPPAIDVPATLKAASGAVEVTGHVSDDSRVVEVTVNAYPVEMKSDGSFVVRRGVPHGNSEIVVAALDEWGNRAQRIIAVSRPLPVTIPPETPPAVPLPADQVADIRFGNYYALVIGNNKYRLLSRLRTAEHDATAVATLLRDDYGFKVRLELNATRADMLRALTEYRAKLTPDDNLLIYYAGHGELDEIAEQGYWLPVDAEAKVPTNWVSTSDVTVMVRAIRAKHIMVVADSCYSGTLVRAADAGLATARARRAWLARMARKRARTALVSGGLEPVMDGGGGGHSVFAKAFIDALRENKGVLDGRGLFERIKRPVVVNSDQTPQYADIRHAGHDGGDFLFVRR